MTKTVGTNLRNRNEASTAIIMATLTCIGLIAGAIPAAANATTARSEIVAYGDLDLASATGVERLNRRVSSAAKRVCEVRSVTGLSARIKARECYVETMDQGRRDISLAVARQRGDTQLAVRSR